MVIFVNETGEFNGYEWSGGEEPSEEIIQQILDGGIWPN